MTPVEVLAAHLPEHGECMVGNWRCICGKEGWGDSDADKTRQFAAHVLDALMKAGHVVVTLPEPELSTPSTHNWMDGTVVSHASGKVRAYLEDPRMSSNEACELAAALLAAATEAGGEA